MKKLIYADTYHTTTHHPPSATLFKSSHSTVRNKENLPESPSEINSGATPFKRPQYLPDMAASYFSSCLGCARVHWFLPRYVQTEHLFWSPWRGAGGGRALRRGSRPQRMEAQAGEPTVSQHRSGCGARVSRHPGQLRSRGEGALAAGGHTHSPPHLPWRHTRKAGPRRQG